MEAVLAHANEVMAARYGYDPKDDHVWGIWNTVKGQETGDKIRLGMEIFFGIIGALTLVIGCVGVANIMYAVVKERTREISVKIALGARRRWITRPFLLGECSTFVGGLAGRDRDRDRDAAERDPAGGAASFGSWASRRSPGRSGRRPSRSWARPGSWPATFRRGAPRRSIPRRP
jgi:hypothetical protein